MVALVAVEPPPDFAPCLELRVLAIGTMPARERALGEVSNFCGK